VILFILIIGAIFLYLKNTATTASAAISSSQPITLGTKIGIADSGINGPSWGAEPVGPSVGRSGIFTITNPNPGQGVTTLQTGTGGAVGGGGLGGRLGGDGGGGGFGCFSGEVAIRTVAGLKKLKDFPRKGSFLIRNLTGVHEATLIVHEHYNDTMIDLGGGKFVTAGHGMTQEGSVPAGKYYHELAQTEMQDVTVYNLHIISDYPEDWHYILEGGDVAHNINKGL